MSMLHAAQGPAELRALFDRSGLVVVPGVYDGISARIAQTAGFEALYISGGAIARGMGYPDIGLVSMTEMVKRLEEIRDVTEVPLIMDADTGYGNAVNVVRMVRAYERAGAAAFHLEDQVSPKRCGHYEGKAVVELSEMREKLRAALEVRRNETYIIARTDARAVLGLDEAIRRGKAFAEEGVDMVFVEAPQSEEEIERIAEEIDAPLLINMFWGGKTPLVPPDRLEQWGYKLLIAPSDMQRAAIKAMQKAAETLRAQGNTASMAEEMVSFQDRERIIGSAEIEEMSQSFTRR